MASEIVLASASPTRRVLLENAGLSPEVIPARVDETAVKESLCHDGASPREVADALAELKALRVSERAPGRMVLGCDQVLDLDGHLMNKPETIDAARCDLMALRGRRHDLLSAVVVCRDGEPIWRHVGEVRMTMRRFSEDYLDEYLARNWHSVRDSVGGYKLEEEGVRLFSKVEGDYFTVLGMPLLDVLSFLMLRGDLQA
ncbi:Maf family protein [Roseovarius salinarum]|uniref:Maf family protein n=1 Tax=Roseovarius salinarum TaxID=1981892 RepID=UPI000C31CCD2|nr:Maf family protein [Roseovarius salinarum]